MVFVIWELLLFLEKFISYGKDIFGCCIREVGMGFLCFFFFREVYDLKGNRR